MALGSRFKGDEKNVMETSGREDHRESLGSAKALRSEWVCSGQEVAEGRCS